MPAQVSAEANNYCTSQGAIIFQAVRVGTSLQTYQKRLLHLGQSGVLNLGISDARPECAH